MSNKYTQSGLENMVDTLHVKMDNVSEKLTSIDITLQRNTDSLELHMKRSDNLEKKLELQEDQFQKDLEPIKKHINMVTGVIKFLGISSTILGILKLFNII